MTFSSWYRDIQTNGTESWPKQNSNAENNLNDVRDALCVATLEFQHPPLCQRGGYSAGSIEYAYALVGHLLCITAFFDLKLNSKAGKRMRYLMPHDPLVGHVA